MTRTICARGWAEAAPRLVSELEAFKPRLAHPNTAPPCELQRQKRAAGDDSHLWSTTVLATLIKSVAAVRGDDSFVEGVDLSSVAGVQRLLERAWDAGFGDGRDADFGGRLLGKTGEEAWIGSVNMHEALCFLGVDADLVEVRDVDLERRAAIPPADARAAAIDVVAAAIDAGCSSLPVVLQVDGPAKFITGVLEDERGRVVLAETCVPRRPGLPPRLPAWFDAADGWGARTGERSVRPPFQLVVMRPAPISQAEARARCVTGADPIPAAVWAGDGEGWLPFFELSPRNVSSPPHATHVRALVSRANALAKERARRRGAREAGPRDWTYLVYHPRDGARSPEALRPALPFAPPEAAAQKAAGATAAASAPARGAARPSPAPKTRLEIAKACESQIAARGKEESRRLAERDAARRAAAAEAMKLDAEAKERAERMASALIAEELAEKSGRVGARVKPGEVKCPGRKQAKKARQKVRRAAAANGAGADGEGMQPKSAQKQAPRAEAGADEEAAVRRSIRELLRAEAEASSGPRGMGADTYAAGGHAAVLAAALRSSDPWV